MKLSIILPTYNEKSNVNPILDRIANLFEGQELEYEIIFVDDSSDDTPEVIKVRAQKEARIRLIHREVSERTGLATAFMKGFEEARGEYVCCLDSDLQHPPEKIKEMLEKAEIEQSDLVIASRYIKGGSAEGLGSLKTFYGIYRRLISIGLKYFMQIIFVPIRKTTDPGTGFFLFKKELLRNNMLNPKGFKILIELIMRTNPQKISEVPLRFLPRENDQSKATIKQGIEFLKHAWLIFRTIPEAGRFLKFCIVGASGVLVNIGTLAILVELFSFSEKGSYIFSVALSILTNYSLNAFFTYGDKKSPSRAESMKRIFYYYAISIGVMFFNYLIFSLVLSWGLHYVWSALIGIAFSTILNFVLVTKLVWKLKVQA